MPGTPLLRTTYNLPCRGLRGLCGRLRRGRCRRLARGRSFRLRRLGGLLRLLEQPLLDQEVAVIPDMLLVGLTVGEVLLHLGENVLVALAGKQPGLDDRAVRDARLLGRRRLTGLRLS